MRILLASASPRRRDTLAALGHDVVVRPVDVDETRLAGEPPARYLGRIVEAKLAAARAIAVDASGPAFDARLVADTVVVIDDDVLQKPRDADEGVAMIRRLAGRTHEVTTRFAIAFAEPHHEPPTHVESVTTRVVFRAVDDDEIAAYVATGEGNDKAGGYALQGRAGAFIARIEGSYGAVIGLPACEVSVALRRVSRG